jgi:Protein of unknown function (DUF3455)
MKRLCILSLSLVVLPACSGDDSASGGNVVDGSVADTTTPDDAGSGQDAAATSDAGSIPTDAGAPDSPEATLDAGAVDADAGQEADADAGQEADAGDGGCPATWFVAPVVDPSIALPDGGGGVLLHAVGTGTQNYMCEGNTSDGGAPYAWTLVTPEANLTDCHEALIGHHFASEAGAGFPEWQTTDGTYVIGTKLHAFTPDGGAGSIPWLLVHAVDAGGSGTLSMAQYVQRLDTDGGNAPADGCDMASVGATTDVPYTADYYFFGP